MAIKLFDPFSAGTFFKHQNLTSIDVRRHPLKVIHYTNIVPTLYLRLVFVGNYCVLAADSRQYLSGHLDQSEAYDIS